MSGSANAICPPRIRYIVELLKQGSLVKSVRVRGYRPTVHRAAVKLLDWEKVDAYQLRRLRDQKAIDHREAST